MDKQEINIEQDFLKKQKELCEKYGAVFLATPFNKFIGISLQSIDTFKMPINGLRHPNETEQVENWYIWAREFSDASDFFQPVHVSHLLEICPKAINYLGLAPGWRFLFDNVYEYVWYDETLLNI
jgi:hypothetical protein